MSKVELQCAACGEILYRETWEVKRMRRRGNRPSCNQACARSLSKIKPPGPGVEVECAVCGTQVVRKQHEINHAKRWGRVLTCGKECARRLGGKNSRSAKSRVFSEETNVSTSECQFCGRSGVEGYCDTLCEELHQARNRPKTRRSRDRAWPERRGEVMER